MQKIDFKKQKIPFTQVANGVLCDAELSFRAKGLYAYLYSKPEGWDFASTRIAKEATDGRDSIRSALKELEDAGYLLRKKMPDGRMLHLVRFPPDPQPENPSLVKKPKPEKATDGNTHSGNSRPISNKDIKVIKNISNKDSDVPSQDVVDVIDEFKKWNPAANMWFGNKTQRLATKTLLKGYGKEEVIQMVASLPKINTLEYVSSATTPKQLLDNAEKIRAQLQRIKSSKPKVI